MKTRGAKVSSFEKPPEQIAYEQATAQWQQAITQVTEQLKIVMPAVKEQPLPELLKMLKQMQESIPQPKPADYGYNPNPKAPPAQQPKPGVPQ